MNNPISNPSAGLLYHWRAFRNRSRWLPFRDAVDRWLSEWLPAMTPVPPMLVIVGPNAGYTIPASFVSRFVQVVAIDPDPSAAILFQARFRRPVQWVMTDYFGLSSKKPDATKLNDLFETYPAAIFLFSNVLGQLPVLLREQKKSAHIEPYMHNLARVFAEAKTKYKIASYHDRYSKNLRRPRESVDHLTGELFANWPLKKEFPWQITAKIEHQIEFAAN